MGVQCTPRGDWLLWAFSSVYPYGCSGVTAPMGVQCTHGDDCSYGRSVYPQGWLLLWVFSVPTGVTAPMGVQCTHRGDCSNGVQCTHRGDCSYGRSVYPRGWLLLWVFSVPTGDNCSNGCSVYPQGWLLLWVFSVPTGVTVPMVFSVPPVVTAPYSEVHRTVQRSTSYDTTRQGNERNHKCPLWLWKRRPSTINCDYNQCNWNKVDSCMTAQYCHQLHICSENLIPKITLNLLANFLFCVSTDTSPVHVITEALIITELK